MGKTKIWICLFAVITFSSVINAASVDFNNTSMTVSPEWVANADNYGKVYGNNFVIDNGVAELTESTNNASCYSTSNDTNSILYSVSLKGIEAGQYNWSIDTSYNSYYTQYNYGQVYLVKDGYTIDLDSNIWNKSNSGSTVISKDYPGLYTGNKQWHTFGSDFTITDKQINHYDAVAFVITGSKSADQILQYDNFNTNIMETAKVCVPEPATIALISSGSLWVLFRRKSKA